jgi:hypothetical protein
LAAVRVFRWSVRHPSEGMVCWPISLRVGNVKNNDPSLVEPIAA